LLLVGGGAQLWVIISDLHGHADSAGGNSVTALLQLHPWLYAVIVRFSGCGFFFLPGAESDRVEDGAGSALNLFLTSTHSSVGHQNPVLIHSHLQPCGV